MHKMGVFVSWSGGKDSCLALYRTLKAGFKVDFLFNMLDEEGSMSRGHGLTKEVLEAQAEAVNIPIIFGKASWESYEGEFKRIVENLKSQGVEGGVFGDLNIQEHRDWVEKVCNEAGIEAFEPLWNEEYEVLLNEFFGNGFEASIVSIKKNLVDEEWVGQPFNWNFIEYLRERKLDLCGEKGEYHTFVTYGPIFKRRVEIMKSRRISVEDKWILEILEYRSF